MKYLRLVFLFLVSGYLHAQCVTQVDTGYEHTVAISTEGNLWAWGGNSSGEAGMGVAIPSYFYEPVLVSDSGDWGRLYAGWGRHSFAIKSDGSLWAWGDGSSGRLGFGDQDNVFVPTQLGQDTDWEWVASSAHTFAKKTDGSLWGWGKNYYGQLGLPEPQLYFEPTLLNAATDFVKLAVGDNHTIGIKEDGTLWACGQNDKGQLGDGTHIDRFIFVQIGTDSDWVDIDAHYKHSMARKSDGTLWGWGSNENNVLGFPEPPFEIPFPYQMGPDTDWVDFDTNGHWSTAIKADGTLWLNSADGFLQMETDADWVSVVSGNSFAFMTKEDGSIWGIGSSFHGQLGLGVQVDFTAVPLELGCENFLGVEAFESGSMVAYPNPTDGMLYISNPKGYPIERFVLSDLTGKVLFVANKNLSEIDLSNYESGIYFLNVHSGNHIGVYKVIKK